VIGASAWLGLARLGDSVYDPDALDRLDSYSKGGPSTRVYAWMCASVNSDACE
jgi:hypothetical protein